MQKEADRREINLSIKIGIPSGLLNFEYEIIWDTFYREIEATVIKSGPTNREILDKGIESCVAEACLPVKIYHGHVIKLIDKVDYILIPRYTSISTRKYICPKFGGLPDLIRNSIDNLPEIIDVEVNFYRKATQGLKAAKEAGSYITSNQRQIKKAWLKALEKFHNSREKFINNCQTVNLPTSHLLNQSHLLKIAVLGHPYMLKDSYINMNLINKLEKMGATVITPEMRDTTELRKIGDILPKKIFWDFGARAVGFARKIAAEGADGLIYVSSFGCGIDAFISEIVSLEVKRAKIPFALINIDEHTGEAGLDTRLEAFVDMITRRTEVEKSIARRSSIKNENYISSFGQCIYNSKSST